MPFASAVPREVVEKWGEDFSKHVVGSGAFKLREWIGGQRIVLEKNPYYWVKGQPHLDGVADQLGVNVELQWLKFESSEIDVLEAIPPSEFPYVMKTPALRALTLNKSTVTTSYLGMNCQMPPFDDVRVRQAFNYAVNKEKLIEVINGRGIVARGVLPPESARLRSRRARLRLRSRQGARAAGGGAFSTRLQTRAVVSRRSDRRDAGRIDSAGPRAGRGQHRIEADRMGAAARSDSSAEKRRAFFQRLGSGFSRPGKFSQRAAVAPTIRLQQRYLLHQSRSREAARRGRADDGLQEALRPVRSGAANHRRGCAVGVPRFIR